MPGAVVLLCADVGLHEQDIACANSCNIRHMRIDADTYVWKYTSARKSPPYTFSTMS